KSGIQFYNCKEFGHVARECQKPKQVKDAAYHREKMLLCKQEEAGIQLNAEQSDWRDDTDDESEDQELEAHYMYMAQIKEVSPDTIDSGPIFDIEPVQKVPNSDNYNVFAIECQHSEQSKSVNDTYPIEQDEHNVIIDSLDMSYDRDQIDQNDDDNDLANERELLASLIEKLKCEIDDNKNRNKFLETSNIVLVEKLKGEIEDFKTKNKSLESSKNRFKEANNKLSETNKLLYNDFKKSQAELERRNDVHASKVEIDCEKAKGDLISYKMESQKTKMPIAVPVSTREPKRTVNQSVVEPLMKTVASEPNQKPRNTTRKLYERISKECSWWYPKFTPPGYKWKPKSKKENVNPNLVEIVLFIVDSGCSKHMTGNLKLLVNFVEKFLGLNYNLFSVGQFCDVDLEVAFRKSTCYIHDLKGNDLLTATSSQAWLWHRRLSHLNFDTINLLSKNDIVVGLPKLKFIKDHLCSSCELGKAKQKSFQSKTTPSSKRRLQLLHMDLCGPMRVASINGKRYVLVIV
nr:hypothetical protein [Tanacetum cinerariifolium]